MINRIQSLEFESHIELENYCIENKLLTNLSDVELKYIFVNYINKIENESKENELKKSISPYQYTL